MAPGILVVLLYLISIQIRALNRSRHSASEPWVFRDAYGWVGTLVKHVAAFIPGLAVLTVFLAFTVVQGYGVLLGGRQWFPGQWLGLRPLRLDDPNAYEVFLFAYPVLILFGVAIFLAGQVGWRAIALLRTYRRAPLGIFEG